MQKVACILKGYPRLSETFIAQELLALESSGVDLIIYSLRHPTDKKIHPVHEKIRARIIYLPEYLYQHPGRVLAGFFKSLLSPDFFSLLKAFFRDFRRDFSINRIRRLGQAMVLCREIEPDREWLYAHFLHTPASVARYCSILTGIPWSCSAHAKDIWTSPDWEIKEKIADMDWLVTCTRANYEHLDSIAGVGQSGKVSLLYHGLDLDRFSCPERNQSALSDAQTKPLVILSVGRAVSKKGYDILLQALSQLPKYFQWKFLHVGGGELSAALQEQARGLSIDDRISWFGAQPAGFVLEQYLIADLFVLPSRIDSNGDRDGLPNVIMEAMSQQLPCIASNISGIPEIIINNKNGVLVAPEQPDVIAREIVRLGSNPVLRRQMGEQARLDVMSRFSLDSSIGSLVARFS
jgi:glycosyltransferase involved in cell wall biosynthesis